jgi:ketosteroid isomerase-like protein
VIDASPDHAVTLIRLLEALIAGDVQSLDHLVTDDVSGWTPNLHVTTRDQLLEAIDVPEVAFSNVETAIDAVGHHGDKAFAEWRIAVDHTGPMVVDEDLLLPPTGRRLHLAGATVAEFDGARVRAFRTYFDDLALLEQVLAPSPLREA